MTRERLHEANGMTDERPADTEAIAGAVLLRAGVTTGLVLAGIVLALGLYRGASTVGTVELALLALLVLSGCGWLAARHTVGYGGRGEGDVE